MSNFLHGVETRQINAPSRPIRTGSTNVVLLVGTAPTGPVNSLTRVTSRAAAATFGKQVPGFTIPYALEAHFKQGASVGPVIVINVFDPTTHVTAVADENVTITEGRGTTANAPVGAAPVVRNTIGDVTYVAGTDYRIDEFGNITVLNSTTIPDGAVEVSYTHLNASAITSAVINGSATAPYTGFELADTMITEVGFYPNVLICPELSQDDTVAAKMAEKAAKYEAVYLLDAPAATTVAEAIAGRGPVGGVPGFNTNDMNLYPTFAYVKTDDGRGNTVSRPLSPFVAGVMSRTDVEFGFWFSASNKPILGITGTSPALMGEFGSTGSDANLLNEAGIATVVNNYGTGFLLWGNRNASAPNNTGADVFLAVQRVRHTISRSIRRAMVPYVDTPITQALIDAVIEQGNVYLRSLQALGAILDGRMYYNPADNPTEQVALGHLIFAVDFMPPSPGERITIQMYLNPEYLENLG